MSTHFHTDCYLLFLVTDLKSRYQEKRFLVSHVWPDVRLGVQPAGHESAIVVAEIEVCKFLHPTTNRSFGK